MLNNYEVEIMNYETNSRVGKRYPATGLAYLQSKSVFGDTAGVHTCPIDDVCVSRGWEGRYDVCATCDKIV